MLNRKDLGGMSKQDSGGKGKAGAKQGQMPAPQWDIPDLIVEPPRSRSSAHRGGSDAGSAPSGRSDANRASGLGSLDLDAQQTPSMGLIDPDEAAQSSLELELDLPPDPAPGPAEAEPARNAEPENSHSRVSSPPTSASAARQHWEVAVDRRTATASAAVAPSQKAPGVATQPGHERRVSPATERLRRARGYAPAATFLAAALLLRLGSCAYSAVSGRETSTGWLAGLLLLGSAALFVRVWWVRSHRE